MLLLALSLSGCSVAMCCVVVDCVCFLIALFFAQLYVVAGFVPVQAVPWLCAALLSIVFVCRSSFVLCFVIMYLLPSVPIFGSRVCCYLFCRLDIPLLGELFRREEFMRVKSAIMVFITCRAEKAGSGPRLLQQQQPSQQQQSPLYAQQQQQQQSYYSRQQPTQQPNYA